MQPPTGTVTFLFTDIEGSTRLWEERADEMRLALAEHDQLLRSAIEVHGGYVFSTGGDGFAAAFSRAHDAIDAARKAQSALAGHPVIRVRMGIHTGEVQERDGDYFGAAVNRAARLMSAGHGGQVLVSQTSAELLGGDIELTELGDHQLRDLSAPLRVWQVGQASFQPLRTLDRVPGNLPRQLSTFVGRGDDLEELAVELSNRPLITLTGVGGVGKTRLALQAAAVVALDYPDGCWLVELAPVASGEFVARAAASVFGLVERQNIESLDLLRNFVSGRKLLIILDNCEHVIDDAAALVDALLSASSTIRVLATSREPLGVDGESVRRVRSLPAAPTGVGVDGALASAAVALFVDRARSANSEFEFVGELVEPVVRLCDRLDGLPLAIELAAARVRGMTPNEIADRLDERFRLLAGGNRRAQERHRTLLAAVEWSHSLLEANERAAFRRLAVFPAEFDERAAEAIVIDDHLAELNVLDALLRLVDKSMVQSSGREHTRYRLLETLRQYGLDRLAEAGEVDDVGTRHATHYLALVERNAPMLMSANEKPAIATLDRELDNIQTMLRWWQRIGDRERLSRADAALFRYWVQWSALEGLDWFDQALALDGAPLSERAEMLGQAAHLAVVGGRHDRAVLLGEASLTASTHGGISPSPDAMFALGWVQTFTDPAAALPLLEQGAAAAAARGDHALESVCLAMIAGNRRRVEGPPHGLVDSARCWAAARASGALYALTGANSCEASLLFEDDPLAAITAMEKNFGLYVESGVFREAWGHYFLGMARVVAGTGNALAPLQRALRLSHDIGDAVVRAGALACVAVSLAQQDMMDIARPLHDFVEGHLRNTGVRLPPANALATDLARVLFGDATTPISSHPLDINEAVALALAAEPAGDA